MSVPVPVPEPKPFYRRRWFIIAAVIVALTAFGSCLNDGKSPSPSATEGDVVRALASQSAAAAAAKETQQAATPKGLSDAEARKLCDRHLPTLPDTENTGVDWSVHWSRTDSPDGAVTIKGKSYNRDREGKRYPSFDVSCTVGTDRKVTDFQFVE